MPVIRFASPEAISVTIRKRVKALIDGVPKQKRNWGNHDERVKLGSSPSVGRVLLADGPQFAS